jgi:hypothetical protein
MDPWIESALSAPDATPMALRLAIGAIALLSTLSGERLYRPTLFAVAFATGAVAAATVLAFLPSAALTPVARLVVVVVGGAAGAVVGGVAHRAALVGVGGVGGAAVGASIAGLFGLPFWVPLIGAVVGAAAMPFLLPLFLKVATPVVGGLLLSWAVGWPGDLRVVVPVAVAGAVFQLFFGGASGDEPEPKDARQERR